MSAQPLASDYHDALTGLPNRRLLDDRLTQALHLARRRDCGVALLLVDLSGFGRIEDDALRAAAERLAGCVRKADTVARWSAAEFALLLTDVESEADCRIAAERALGALGRDAAIGISMYPADAGEADALARNADAARLRARQQGRREYRFYGA